MRFLYQALLLSLCTSLMCSATPLHGFHTQEKQQEVAGVHKMTFGVKRGSNYLDSTYSGKPRFVKRLNDDGTVSVDLQNESSFYLIDLSIGSDNQTIGVLIDTGSSDLWVMGSNNPYCESSSSSSSNSKSVVIDKLQSAKEARLVRPAGHQKDIGGGGGGGPPEIATTSTDDGNFATEIVSALEPEATVDCSQYGTFDESSSSTFHSNNSEFLIQYADYTFAYGDWGRDDVTLGGVTVKDLSFAVANESNSTIGVLGIGLSGLETTYAGSLTKTTYQYANLPLKLVEQGLINKLAYSLYLGSSDATSGTILFGGVDHNKYTGTLGVVPIINTLSAYNFDTPIKLEITLSGITIGTSDTEEAVITTTLAPALLDSGTTLTYVPELVMIKIGEALGASYSSAIGAFVMECLDSSNTSTIDFEFSGVTISVPITDLQVETTGGSASSTSFCAVGVLSSGEESYILGDSFLRSAYVVYDLEDLQIGLAQSNHNAKGENIEAISSSIPSAVTASAYSSTYSSLVFETDTQLTYKKKAASTSTTSEDSTTTGSGSSSPSSATSSSSGSSSSSSSSSSESKKSSATKADSNLSLVYALTAATIMILFGL